MKPEKSNAMPHQPDHSELRDVLSAVFGLASLEAGQIEWLLDRIEGTSRSRRWA